jgi:hypothetical protein
MAIALIDLMNGADVGMIECRGRSSFALKSLQSLAVANHLRRQELEGYISAEFEVKSAVNHSHAATAQPVFNAVMGNSFAKHAPLATGRPILGRGYKQVNAAGAMVQ